MFNSTKKLLFNENPTRYETNKNLRWFVLEPMPADGGQIHAFVDLYDAIEFMKR